MEVKAPKVLLELRPSLIHNGGVGVFAVTNMRAGQYIAEGIEESDYEFLVPWQRLGEFDEDLQRKIHDFCIGTPEGFIPPENLDFNRLTIEWFFNHSCDGNVGFGDAGNFITRRAIRKGEELTYDYGLAESNPAFRMKCMCGSKHCRQVITGDDWKDPAFHKANAKFMLPRLRRLRPAAQPTQPPGTPLHP
jgi:hypothetical protein